MGEPRAVAQLSPAGRDNDGSAREYSAGGVVVDQGRALLVQVRNLKGELVWTFPKGHLEKGEGPREAALREVEEETGWRCRILAPLKEVRYSFMRSGRLIRKRVRWYWMAPGARLGKADATEVQKVGWVSFRKAASLLRYPADLEILSMTQERFGRGNDGPAAPPPGGEGQG